MGFYIGRIYGFKWGERPFHGKMSEVRVWSVARTENQLKQICWVLTLLQKAWHFIIN
jgi:hypothetical protein